MVFRLALRAMPLVVMIAVVAACSVAEVGSAQIVSVGPRDVPVGGWSSADIVAAGGGSVSPTGEVTMDVTGDRMCFRSLGAGVLGACVHLPTDGRRVAQFSPDGRQVLVISGPDESERIVLVVDVAEGGVRVVEPDGVTDLRGEPRRWGVSGAAWAADGTSVVLLPLATGDDGPLLAVRVQVGEVTQIGRLPAELVNGQPTMHAAGTGIALGAHMSGDRQSVWWIDLATGGARRIGGFAQRGGSVLITAVDPFGRDVLACPWYADGTVGATVGIAVDTGETTRLLADSESCAGTVYSADGRFLAVAAEQYDGYALTVVDLKADRRVLSVPLPAPEPTLPPYLKWLGDTVVVTDVSGQWATSSVIVRLRR